MIFYSYESRVRVDKFLLKSDMRNLEIAFDEYCSENGYSPNKIQDVNWKRISNPTYVEIETKSSKESDSWYIEASLYDIEKRFLYSDIKKIIKSYYCNQDK